ncbi:MAG: TRAP transporter small permease, partial [Halomonas sp.]|nr:TRAP transporter small permease [Halomonas sp.]
ALAYAAWLYVLEALHGGWTTGTVWNPPLWPALLPMAVGISLLSLQYVAEILRGDT